MTAPRLDNLRLVSAKHTEHALRPDSVDGLPVEEDDTENSTGSPHADAEGTDSSDASDKAVCPPDAADVASGVEVPVVEPYPPVRGRRCGRRPVGAMGKKMGVLPSHIASSFKSS